MDRNRDARRAGMTTTNGLSRRRHRSSSLRDSPEEDGPVELQETSRLRDRKKDRDRDRDRDRERERDRDRDRDRDRLSRSKRRRGERLMHGSNKGDDGGDDTSEESVNDEDEDEDDVGGGGGGSIRMLSPNPSTTSISSSLNHRKSFSPVHTLNSNKHFRPLTGLKGTDEMIGVSVPRKARSASTKRSHDWPSSCGVVGADQIHRQASTSPVRQSISAMVAPAPSSPSSSHASAVRKKLKPNGPKLRPPRTSSTKTSSSAQDEIEIEIAEVLYGMMRQPHVPSKQEVGATDSIKFESREANKSTSDAKSRVSSPISNSPCALAQPASAAAFPQNSSSSVTSMSAVAAPKRKRPRPVKYGDENPSSVNVQNSPISSTVKAVANQPAKVESSSPNLEKIPGSAAENGGFPCDLLNSQAVQAPPEAQPEPIRLECKVVSDSRPENDELGSQNVKSSKEEPQSPKKESTGLRLEDNRQALTVTKTNSTVLVIENQREEKYQFDLMALPERDGEVDFIPVDPKPAVMDAETEIKAMSREDDKVLKIGKEEPANLETEKSKTVVAEESAAAAADFKKPINGNKERSIDLQLDLDKTEKDSGTAGFSASKVHHNVIKQQQQQQNTEKSVQSSSVPLPMSVAGWPGAIPPMGYMAPLQGVLSMDGSTVSSAAIQPPHLLFNQPRPKRCATHCYIARNIYYHQQMSRMNPFWPMAPGSGGSLYGAKHCNPNVLPPELHGNIPSRGVNSCPDKGQGLAMFPGQTGKDKSSQSANVAEAQRKQLVLQQALPPGAPSNILHGPAFIFPLSQQQAAAAASGRPGSVKSPNAGGAVSSSASITASISATATAAAAPAMSFNYPNMAANEPQYLAILQNNAYPFTMPAHVGTQTAYRGPHGQAMPYFNGSFYSSTMLHPSHLQQPQQQPPSQSQQSQQGHQNTTISSGSSSSQKHLQNQQQRPHPGVANGGNGSLQGFAASKNQSSQALQQQQQQRQQLTPHVPLQFESEMGGEDSPSTADSRVSRANMNIYSQNFAMPMHPPNFALLTPPSIGSASGASAASGAEKKQQQQQQGAKVGVDASQAFAVSFASINGATAASGIDLTSMNQAILQSFPDVTRPGYHQFMAAAAAQAAQQKKSYRVTEEGKTGGGDPSNVEEERKAISGKASSTVGHSIAFSRPDLTDAPISGNNVIDSSARTLNLSSTPARVSNSVMPAAVSNVIAPTPQQQLQQMQQQVRNQQQQMQQMIQLQKQQFSAAARTKTPATSNGSVYSDHLPSTSSMAAKFPNALSSFPQNLVQSTSSPAQTQSQWKNSSRTTTSQLPSSSLASSTSSTHKNLPQKHGRMQQSHTQISFAANTKSSSPSQGLQPASSNQSPSPPVVVGSPTTTTSSMSKSAGGSPRTTTSTPTGNKAGQPSSLSSQQAKNSPSGPTQKSSPVGGRNVPSILGSTGTKPQLQQQQQHQHQHQHQQQQQLHQQQHQHQQQQQQLSKQSIQQAQFFSNVYIQTQASHSNNATSASPASGYYHIPRCRPDQQQQQQSQGSSGTSSSGMLSLCPGTHANTGTNDPAKAAAVAAANNMKGGGLSSQTIMHAQFAAAQSSGLNQLVPAGFPYVQAVPTAVQVKPAEQKKQPAGE